MDDKDKKIEYEDAEQYKGGSEAPTIKEVSMKLFQKAMIEGSKEMIGAGVDKRLINGEVVEFIRPNQREVFINSVEMAFIPLKPKAEGCKKEKIKEMFKNFDKEKKEIIDKYSKDMGNLNEKYKQTLSNQNSESHNQSVSDFNREIDNLKIDFEWKQVSISKGLLKAISYLLDELKYFEESGGVSGS